MSEALRHNTGKPRVDEVLKFGKALDDLTAVMTQGAVKYELDNWLKGGKPDNEYHGSALRHLRAHVNGELYDPETGCLHLAHVAWNVLAELRLNYPDTPSLNPAFDQAAFEEQWA